MSYFAQVHGPNIFGGFGNSETHIIDEASDAEENETGSLIIYAAARPALPHNPDRPGVGRGPRAERVVIYPRGEWTRLTIGVFVPHG